MLGRQAQRFIRTKWASAQELAEELYATFSPLMPIEASKIIINQNPDDESPPFVINRPGDATGPTITINRGGGDTNFGDTNIHGANFGGTDFNLNRDYGLPGGGSSLDLGFFPDTGGIDSGSGGGVDLNDIVFPDQEPGSVPASNNTPFMLYGEVVAKESGRNYAVNVWAVSPTGPRAGTISVRFPMVDPEEEIPAGTQIPVMCFPGQSGSLRRVIDAVGFIAVYLE